MSRAAEISGAFIKSQPASAARALDQVSPADVAAFLESLAEADCAAVLSRMQPSRAAAILELLAPVKAAGLLHHAPPHVRYIMMRALAAPIQQAILKAAPRRQAAVLSRSLSYDPATVGAWMDAPGATFPPQTTVSDCLTQLRSRGTRLISSVFVIGEERVFLGTVDLDSLLAAGDEETLSAIMQRGGVTISPQANLGSVVSLEAWDTALSLPVTDRRQQLVGSLRFDSLREGLDIHHGALGGPRLNMVVMHMAQAFLISLSGLLHVATSGPSLSRLSSEPEQREGGLS
jgi:Mg/Co/Ni transporter MgtE